MGRGCPRNIMLRDLVQAKPCVKCFFAKMSCTIYDRIFSHRLQNKQNINFRKVLKMHLQGAPHGLEHSEKLKMLTTQVLDGKWKVMYLMN